MLPINVKYILTLLAGLLAPLAYAQRTLSAPAELIFGGAPVSLNVASQQRLQTEIDRLYADRAALRSAIEQLQYIESVLNPMLAQRTVSTDFRYVCLPIDVTTGAYWNLDARKAGRLNLRVDNTIDERLNVISSSEAVLTELATLHQRTPNWASIFLAFVAGEGGSQTQLDDVPQVGGPIRIQPENPPLIWLTLARKLVFEREIPLLGANANSLLLYDYRQGRGKTLAAISRELQIDQTRFMPFNDWLRARVIPGDRTYPVLIRLTPSEFLTVKGRVNATVQVAATVPTGNTPRDMGFPILRRLPASGDPLTRMSALFYEINDLKGIQAQSCDNLITLSYYGKLSVPSFRKMNDMTERDLVRPGDLYYLEQKARKAKVPYHVMQEGQSLRDVATIYGIQLKYILKYNHLEGGQRLPAGRILWLREKRPANVPPEYQIMPEPAPEPTVASRNLTREDEESAIDTPLNDRQPSDSTQLDDADSARVTGVDTLTTRVATPPPILYTVQPGDTHTGVAQRYGISLTDLMNWNSLSYRKPLVVGQQLVVGKPAPPRRVMPQPVTDVPKSATGATNAGTSSAVVVPPAVAVRQPVPGRARETGESVVDVPAPAPPRPQRLVNRVRVETPKVNGRSYYHIVQRGQTVYRVALINKVSVQNVVRWNNLPNYTIEIGQRLLIRK